MCKSSSRLLAALFALLFLLTVPVASAQQAAPLGVIPPRLLATGATCPPAVVAPAGSLYTCADGSLYASDGSAWVQIGAASPDAITGTLITTRVPFASGAQTLADDPRLTFVDGATILTSSAESADLIDPLGWTVPTTIPRYVGTLANYDSGSITVIVVSADPVNSMVVEAILAGGNDAPLSAAFNDLGGDDYQVLITLGTDEMGNNDPTKNTDALVKAAIQGLGSNFGVLGAVGGEYIDVQGPVAMPLDADEAGWSGGPSGPFDHVPWHTSELVDASTTPYVLGIVYKIVVAVGSQIQGILTLSIDNGVGIVAGSDGAGTFTFYTSNAGTGNDLHLIPSPDYDGTGITVTVTELPTDALAEWNIPAADGAAGIRWKPGITSTGDAQLTAQTSDDGTFTDTIYDVLNIKRTFAELLSSAGGTFTFDAGGVPTVVGVGSAGLNPSVTNTFNEGSDALRWLTSFVGTGGIDSTGSANFNVSADGDEATVSVFNSSATTGSAAGYYASTNGDMATGNVYLNFIPHFGGANEATFAISVDGASGNPTPATDFSFPGVANFTDASAYIFDTASTIILMDLVTTSTDGVVLENTSTATAGVPVQISPRLRLRSRAYDGMISQTLDFWTETLPVSAATPTATYKLGFSRNGDTAVYPFSITSAGTSDFLGALSAVGLSSTAYLSASATSYVNWSGRTVLRSPASGQINLLAASETEGIGFDFATDSILKVRNRDQNAYAAIQSNTITLVKSVSTLTSVATTATATSTAHHLVTGDSIVMAGATQAEYNGTYTITVTGADTFTYTFAGSGTSPATGTITASKTL